MKRNRRARILLAGNDLIAFRMDAGSMKDFKYYKYSIYMILNYLR